MVPYLIRAQRGILEIGRSMNLCHPLRCSSGVAETLSISTSRTRKEVLTLQRWVSAVGSDAAGPHSGGACYLESI